MREYLNKGANLKIEDDPKYEDNIKFEDTLKIDKKPQI